jgi:hypothetical protein
MSVTQKPNGKYEVRWRDPAGRHRSLTVGHRSVAEQMDGAVQEEIQTQADLQALVNAAMEPGHGWLVVHNQLPAVASEWVRERAAFKADVRWAMGGPVPQYMVDADGLGRDDEGRLLGQEGQVIERPTLESVVEDFLQAIDDELLTSILQDEGF